MPLLAKIGSFTENATTGNHAVTGVGFQPKAVFFWSADFNDEEIRGNVRFSLGAGISSSERFALAIYSDNNAATSDTSRALSTHVYVRVDGTNAIVSSTDLVSMDTDGFTLNRDVDDTNDRLCSFLALGGDSLTNSKIVTFASPTSTGTQAITGVGFEPDLVVIVGMNSATEPPNAAAAATFSIGAATASTQGATGGFSNDAQAAASASHSHLTTTVVSVPGAGQASLDSMDADGFTLDWTAVSASGRHYYAICLRGGSYTVGEISQRTTDGETIVSLGHRPAAVWFQSANDVTNSSNAEDLSLSLGMTDGVRQHTVWEGDNHGSDPTAAHRHYSLTNLLFMYTNGADTPTLNATGQLGGFTGSGFKINWDVETGGDAERKILYVAFGPAANSGGGGKGKGPGGGGGNDPGKPGKKGDPPGQRAANLIANSWRWRR